MAGRPIRELQQKHGTAVLFITHDTGVVVDIADRVCVMRHGRIVETGAVQQVLTQPREEYTKALLAAVPSLAPRAARQEIANAQVVLDVVELGKTYPVSGSAWSLLRKHRQGTPALQDVTFMLKKGRTLGIVGESGSGKSTLARCVMRLLKPTCGAVRVTGNDISELTPAGLKPHRKRIQMIFQDPNRSLNPRLSIGQSLVEGPVNYEVPLADAWARAQELLALVGLPADAIDRYPHQFSGGQRQRIAIARALAMAPDVIVADEAVSALEKAASEQSCNCDCYPYAASSTTLDAWRVDGQMEILITWSEPHPEMAKQTLKAIAAQWGVDQWQATERLRPAGAIYNMMHEDDVRQVLAHPLAMVGSDGLPNDPNPHPRLWGTFPRVLAHYCRDLQLFTLPEAVRKMTGLSATRFRLQDRGVVRVGAFADLTLVDMENIQDVATYQDPCRTAPGIDLVIVNGVVSYEHGQVQQRQGRMLVRQPARE